MQKNVKNYYFFLIIGTLIMLTIWCCSDGISGNDFWWHVKAGEWIVKNGKLPVYDMFSWMSETSPIPWIAHEWLAEVILYCVHTLFGDLGIFALSLGSVIGLNFCMLWINRKKMFDNFIFTVVFSCFFCVTATHAFFARPHIFGFWFFFAEMYCLYRFYENRCSRSLCFLPILTVLWSNIHGGSAALAYVLPLLLLICGLTGFRCGRLESVKLQQDDIRKLLAVILADIAAICVNPFGIRLLMFPYKLMGNQFQMSIIMEWAAPDIKLIGSMIFYFLPVLMTVIGIMLSEKKIELFDFAIMLIFLFLFLRSQRFIIQYYIASAFWAYKYVIPQKLQTELKLYEKGMVGCLGILFGLVSIWNVKDIVHLNAEKKLISRELSEEMLETVMEDQPERLFNDYDFGDILIYSEIPVFFDSRSDMYAETVILKDGIALLALQPGAAYENVESMISSYGFDSILIREGRPLCAYLSSHPERYALIKQSGDSVYYKVLY